MSNEKTTRVGYAVHNDNMNDKDQCLIHERCCQHTHMPWFNAPILLTWLRALFVDNALTVCLRSANDSVVCCMHFATSCLKHKRWQMQVSNFKRSTYSHSFVCFPYTTSMLQSLKGINSRHGLFAASVAYGGHALGASKATAFGDGAGRC